MSDPYKLPQMAEPTPLNEREIFLIASGDLRDSANCVCWDAQASLEKAVETAFQKEGYRIRRAHPFDLDRGHGFISSQRMGMDVFERIHPHSRLIVAEAVWQYSHHVLAGLRSHKGPILTLANWSGQWPGLVGLLNLNGSLTKAGVAYSTLWSNDMTDDFFLRGIRDWLKDGRITHDESHVRLVDPLRLPSPEAKLGRLLARELISKKAILGIFDEGCMGMYNAIIDDELLNPLGVYKERLSQSALFAAMQTVSDQEAQQILDWLVEKGVTFDYGSNPETELTKDQVIEQCRMYVAAVRIAAEFGCAAIGIQYQQGLKDLCPASDLAEGLLNNPDRPPVFTLEGKGPLYPGEALPHFNEVDEGAALDALVTHRVWKAMGLDPSTTLHDVRWGEHYTGEGIDDFVWVFMISGAAPASHFTGGYAGTRSERQPPMYFPLGGGTLKGVSRPGPIVWSRVFVQKGSLNVDLGLGQAVALPDSETQRRWQATTPQWPIMHAVLNGISRDQMMARHKANHLNVAYAPSAEAAERALSAKAAMFAELGVKVFRCGD